MALNGERRHPHQSSEHNLGVQPFKPLDGLIFCMHDSSPGVTSASPRTSSPDRGGDAEDVALAVAGDRRAFERIYRRHVGRIHGLAGRLMGRDEAGEITQDVFVRAWEKLASFRGEAQFGTWLYRLAVNVIMGRRAWLGTRRQRFIADDVAMETAPARPVPTDTGLDFETAIGKLPPGARTVFVLHDVEGYRHEEIATLLEVTTGTTKAQLHRARMMLRRHLDA
jgi:RNA polymerase sigma-70 factor (ECF subfamily)